MTTIADFPPGTKVVRYRQFRDAGVVVCNTLSKSPNQVVVEWNDGDVETLPINWITRADSLDKEFLEYAEKVETKATEVVSLLKEIDELAEFQEHAAGDVVPRELYQELTRLATRFGWSSSTKACYGTSD